MFTLFGDCLLYLLTICSTYWRSDAVKPFQNVIVAPDFELPPEALPPDPDVQAVATSPATARGRSHL